MELISLLRLSLTKILLVLHPIKHITTTPSFAGFSFADNTYLKVLSFFFIAGSYKYSFKAINLQLLFP